MDTGAVDPQDWITIWQSELSALAVDREAHEGLVALSQAWASLAHDRDDGPAGRAGADAPPGTAAPGAASGPGDEIDRLRRRIAELERAAAAAGGR